jgi:hypothetical protein
MGVLRVAKNNFSASRTSCYASCSRLTTMTLSISSLRCLRLICGAFGAGDCAGRTIPTQHIKGGAERRGSGRLKLHRKRSIPCGFEPLLRYAVSRSFF